MNLFIYNTVEELNEDLAEYIISIAEKAITHHNCFNFVLTGGSSPKALYNALATTYKNRIDWSKVYFFFGDERNVHPNHESYNGLMAKESLFNLLGTADDHIFYVDTTLAPQNAAIEYKKALSNHFKHNDIVFDLVLLGMGDDAHTASLFPDTGILNEVDATVASVFVEKLNSYRISLTAPLINKAHNVAFLVFGEGKAKAAKHVIGDEKKNYKKYPAQLIAPLNDKLTWFLDNKAAALLED